MLDAAKNKGEPHFYLRNPNVKWFEVDTSDLKQMPFEAHELVRFGLEPGDVVVCEGGEAGRAAIWNGQVAGVKFQKALHRVRPGPQLFNRYLVHRIKFDYDTGNLADYYTGATIKHLTGKDFARYRFPLPPLPEQRRIAAILDKADALRAKRREAISKLDQLLQSVFLDMFGDPVTNPMGWPVGKVGDLLDSVAYGTSEKAALQGRVPVLRMSNITYSGEIDLTDLKYIDFDDENAKKYSVEPGELLFNRTNSKELVGKTAVYSGPTPMAFAGYLVRGRVKVGHSAEYIAGYLNSPWGKKTLQSMCKSIVGMANINAREFCGIEIAIPHKDVQWRFANLAKAIQRHKVAHRRQLSALSSQFEALQNKAFAGAL
jgi:type I restriction enzyme, S subunit